MDDPRARLARLSPEKQRLLERLAARERATPRPGPAAVIDETRFDFDKEEGIKEKSDIRAFYDAVNGQLNASELAGFSLFLNYGYVENDAPSFAQSRPSASTLGKNAVRLVLELVGDFPLRSSQRVLDVGCGRGGTVSVLRRYFEVGPVTGLDLSSVAIDFCARAHGDEATHFLVGDAEHLPFDDASFDVLTNVESSHAYPDPDAFFRQASRVLKPGGVFLYTDIVATQDRKAREAFLATLGLFPEHFRDITSNVLLSCDETAASHTRAFRSDNSAAIMERFLGVRGTALYDAMKDGTQKYLLYRFRKGEAAL